MTATDVKNWVIAADFFAGPGARWLDDFISDARFSFTKVAPPVAAASWHSQRSRVTSLSVWLRHFRQARTALAQNPDGVVTCFPQLAMCAALIKRFGRRKPALIAYNYNLGALPGGWRQKLARLVAAQIDCFVVHSPQEQSRYAAYLGVDPERIIFAPLQRGKITLARAEDKDAPFVLAMGSAHRDYPTLIEAVDALGIPTTIVTRPDEVARLAHKEHVTFLSGLSQQDCMDLLARARLSVTPVANLETASGQVTFVNAMMLGVPVIATACPGTDGYIDDGRTGVLVPPFKADVLAREIERLWQDGAARDRLAAAARIDAQERFSDEVAAARLAAIMAQLTCAPEHEEETRSNA